MHPEKQRHVRLVGLIVIACILLDQATKALALAVLPPHTIHLLGNLVRLQLSENTGAFLSLGAAFPSNLRFWVFTAFSALMLAAVAVYLIRTHELPTDLTIALAAVLGGGLGNLIDRATRGGRVVDFLNVGIGWLRTGVFNVADMAILFGALYAIWDSLRPTPRREETNTSSSG